MVAVTVDEVVVELVGKTKRLDGPVGKSTGQFQKNMDTIEVSSKQAANTVERNFSKMANAGSKVGKAAQQQSQQIQRINSLYSRGATQANAYTAALNATTTAINRQRGAAAGLRGTLRSLAGAFAPRALLAGFAGGLAFGAISILEQGLFAALGALKEFISGEDEAKQSSEELESAINSLESSVAAYSAAVKFANKDQKELTKEFGLFANEAKRLGEQRLDLTRALALQDLQKATEAIEKNFNIQIGDGLLIGPQGIKRLEDALAETGGIAAERFRERFNQSLEGGGPLLDPNIIQLNPDEGIISALSAAEQGVKSLADRFKITDDQAKQLVASIEQAGEKGATAAQRLTAFQNIVDILREARGNLEGADEATLKLVADLLKAAENALQIEKNAANIPGVLNQATAAANELAGALANAADNAAAAVAGAETAAKISAARLKFFGDPEGFAGARAAIEFDNRQRDFQSLDRQSRAQIAKENPALVAQIAQEKDAFVELNKEIARNQEEYRKRLAAARGGGRSGRRSGGGGRSRSGGGGSQNGFSRLVEELRAETEAFKLQSGALTESLGVFDQAKAKAEALRVEQQLLAEAIKAGVQITPELRARISELATEYANAKVAAGGFTQSLRQNQQAASEFGSIASDAVKGFINDLRQGKSAGEALLGVVNRLADRFLDLALNAIFGGGGGGGGGIFASLFGGLLGFRKGAVPAFRRGRIPGYRSGSASGIVNAPGTGRDGVLAGSPGGPIFVDHGEAIINREMTRKHRDLLEAINNGRLRSFQSGFVPGGGASSPTQVDFPGIDLIFVRDEAEAFERMSRTPRGRKAILAFNRDNETALNQSRG